MKGNIFVSVQINLFVFLIDSNVNKTVFLGFFQMMWNFIPLNVQEILYKMFTKSIFRNMKTNL